MKLLLLLSLAVSLYTSVAGQQINTVEVGKTKYFVSNLSPYSPRLNWFLAYQYCRNIGMELLSMQNKEESNQIISYLGAKGFRNMGFWTSGNRLGNNMWIWMTSGHPFNATFNFWPKGNEPARLQENTCNSLMKDTWAARPCSENKPFICQLTRCYYFNYVVSGPSREGKNSTIATPHQEAPTKTTIIPGKPKAHENEVNTLKQQVLATLDKETQNKKRVYYSKSNPSRHRRKEEFKWALL